MDKSVPASAAHILEFIYVTETGRKIPECYDVIIGHHEDELHKPITTMTLRELQVEQAKWGKKWKSSASGAAQFMRRTLAGLIEELHLDLSMVFDPGLQDRLAYHLLKRRGFHEFILGKISRTEFGKRLAMEWASLPVLTTTKGGSRTVHRGQSFYAGDGLNKSLVTPEKLEYILDTALRIAKREEMPVNTTPKLDKVIHDANKAMATSKTVIGTTAVTISGTVAAVNEITKAAKDVKTSAEAVMAIGPWALLAVVIVGVGVYLVMERKRKANLAKAAKEDLDGAL